MINKVNKSIVQTETHQNLSVTGGLMTIPNLATSEDDVSVSALNTFGKKAESKVA